MSFFVLFDRSAEVKSVAPDLARLVLLQKLVQLRVWSLQHGLGAVPCSSRSCCIIRSLEILLLSACPGHLRSGKRRASLAEHHPPVAM